MIISPQCPQAYAKKFAYVQNCSAIQIIAMQITNCKCIVLFILFQISVVKC